MFRLLHPNSKEDGEEVREAVNAFLNCRRLSEHTKRQYKADLKVLSKFLNIDLDSEFQRLAEVTRRDVLRYFNWQIDQPGMTLQGYESAMAASSVNQRIGRLRKLFRALEREKLIEKNPFPDELGLVETEQKHPTRAVPEEFVRKILESPGKDIIGMRDKAFLECLFGCGLRVGEIISLQIEQFDRVRGCFLDVQTKGKRAYNERRNPALTDSAVVAVHALLYRRERDFTYPDTFIFKSYRRGEKKKEGHMNASTASRIFKKYVEAVGLDSRLYSPHSCRATTITHLLDKGLSHRDVRHFSGHSSIKMVEYYDKRRVQVEADPAKKITF